MIKILIGLIFNIYFLIFFTGCYSNTVDIIDLSDKKEYVSFINSKFKTNTKFYLFNSKNTGENIIYTLVPEDQYQQYITNWDYDDKIIKIKKGQNFEINGVVGFKLKAMITARVILIKIVVGKKTYLCNTNFISCKNFDYKINPFQRKYINLIE